MKSTSSRLSVLNSLSIKISRTTSAELLDEVCKQIREGKEDNIFHQDHHLDHAGVVQIAEALNSRDVSKPIEALHITGAFPSAKLDRLEDLILLWEAAKSKVKTLDLSENNISPAFKEYLKKDRDTFKALQAESKTETIYPKLMIGNSDIQESTSSSNSSLPNVPDPLRSTKSDSVVWVAPKLKVHKVEKDRRLRDKSKVVPVVSEVSAPVEEDSRRNPIKRHKGT